MKRRIILLLVSFAVLMAAFWGYRLATRLTGERKTTVRSDTTDQQSATQPARPGAGKKGVPDVRTGSVLTAYSRDDQGRLRGVYQCARWDKTGDRTYVLTEPRIEFYFRGGQRLQVTAKSARAVLEGSGLDSARWFSFTGDVRTQIDLSTEPARAPLEERPDDRVLILTDQADLDREALRVQAPGEVLVESAQADVKGHGLTATWKQAPAELELLYLKQGERAVLKRVAADAELFAMPGGESTVGASPETGEPRPPARTADRALPAKPKAADRRDQPPAQNIYNLSLRDGVRVAWGDRVMDGVDELRLRLEWESARADERRAEPARGQATTAAASQPAEAYRPVVVTWRGPMELRPIGHTPTPSSKRIEVSGSGPAVVLNEPRVTAMCARFAFEQDTSGAEPVARGRLEGKTDEPVVLTMSDGPEIIAPTVRVDRHAGKAYADGTGQATWRARRDQPDAPAQTARCTWRDSAELTFLTEKVRQADGTVRARQRPDVAVCRGKVELTQEGADDFVRCHVLELKSDRGPSGRVFLSRAIASGSVEARREGSDIQARRMTMDFREEPPRPPAAGAVTVRAGRTEGLMADARVRAVLLVADGDVRVTSKQGDQPPMIAHADTLRSELERRNAVLRGWAGTGGASSRPASIAQGDNRLEGGEIRLYEVTDAAGRREVEVRVDGSGTLAFMTHRDLNGRDLPQPRAIRLTWAKAMSYLGQNDQAEFFGNVRLDSGDDHMQCQTMRVWFERMAPTTAPAAEALAAGKAERPDRPLALGIEPYSRRRIRQIHAERDVVLRSGEEAEGKLLRRFQLTGEDLKYDAALKRVNVTGRGTLVAEDYRPPDKAAARAAGGSPDADLAAMLERPSQTAMEWQRMLELAQDERRATASGEVEMRHRSGARVVLTERLNVPDWGRLEGGRAIDLACGNASVEFDPPNPVKTDSRPAQVGPVVGPLRRVSASRSVNLKDPPWQVLAERLLYDREPDTVYIWGYLEDYRPVGRDPLPEAQLVHEDRAAGRSQTWSSPMITWYRKTDRVVTQRVTGAGGR